LGRWSPRILVSEAGDAQTARRYRIRVAPGILRVVWREL
jgi:hypothetical protein